MGHTLSQWQTKVAELLRDAGAADFTPAQITTVGITPAIVEYSTIRARRITTEAAGAASPYFDLPPGWVVGYSSLVAVEHPARQDPPEDLDALSWRIVQSPSDVAATQVLLDRSPAAGTYVRFTFTAPWPVPTATETDDKIGDIGFEACCALAASLCCLSLLTEGARSQHATEPTDWTPTRDRVRDLQVAAEMYRSAYERLLGLSPGGAGAGDAGGGRAPAHGSFDFDPSHQSLFHGGRR